MPVLVLEGVDATVHLVRESARDNKGRRTFTTRCGVEVERDTAFVTVWASDVTCHECAVPLI